ncbi:MAG TPA: hypothetical protein VHS81_11005 [Caulobacteraceae bacterium]|nr:hypothetical protein [Caulobacteraceae bacterium]
MDFYDPGPLRRVAINLFYGWGYSFYRLENQWRADDQLVRAKAAGLLARAHAALDRVEQDFRREKLPPPSQAHPFPDAGAVANCQKLERLGAEIGGLTGRLHALPAPENDRMTQRYRSEAETLIKLGAIDAQLVGQCELLRASLDGKPGDWVLENLATLQGGLAAIGETVRERQAVLT